MVEWVMDSLITEVFSWVQHLSASAITTSQKTIINATASNLVLFGYIITSLINRKATILLCGFLLSEVLGGYNILDSLSEINYYLVFSVLYCLIYRYMRSRDYADRHCFVLAVPIAFFLGMTIDSAIYSYTKSESSLYHNYESLIVLVHLCCMSVFIHWGLLEHVMGEAINRISGILRNWYIIKH